MVKQIEFIQHEKNFSVSQRLLSEGIHEASDAIEWPQDDVVFRCYPAQILVDTVPEYVWSCAHINATKVELKRPNVVLRRNVLQQM